jgi:hypothetical protein
MQPVSSAIWPVLRYRAMIHGVSVPGLAAWLYFTRYTEDAVDLCDILSSFAPHTKASLNELPCGGALSFYREWGSHLRLPSA